MIRAKCTQPRVLSAKEYVAQQTRRRRSLSGGNAPIGRIVPTTLPTADQHQEEQPIMGQTESTLPSPSSTTEGQKTEATVVDFAPFQWCQTTDQEKISWLALDPHLVIYNPNKGNQQFIFGIPEEVWVVAILQPYLRLKDLAVLCCSCKFFDNYLKSVVARNLMAICVPEDVPN